MVALNPFSSFSNNARRGHGDARERWRIFKLIRLPNQSEQSGDRFGCELLTPRRVLSTQPDAVFMEASGHESGDRARRHPHGSSSAAGASRRVHRGRSKHRPFSVSSRGSSERLGSPTVREHPRRGSSGEASLKPYKLKLLASTMAWLFYPGQSSFSVWPLRAN